MKYLSLIVVVLSFSVSSSLAKAAFVRVPVDPSIARASDVPDYDPTVAGSATAGVGMFVQESQAPRLSETGTSHALATQSVSIMGASVGPLVRWPASGKPERVMQNATAYYRDAFIGIRYTVNANQDRDYWTVKIVYPTEDGSARTQMSESPPLIYYQQVGDWKSCWYSPGWLYYICDTTSLEVTTYRRSQCDPAGSWSLQLFQNGAAIGQPSPFTMRLEVPPTTDTPESPLLALNQNTTPAYPYDSLCYRTDHAGTRVFCNPDPNRPDPKDPTRFLDSSDPNLRAFSIGAKGCAVTAAAMVNAYHNGVVPDGGLISYHDTIKATGGFSVAPGTVGNVVWSGLPRGATSWIGYGSFADSELRKMICTNGPQVLSVKGGGHFVMVVGRTDNSWNTNNSWKIHDPANGRITDLAAAGYSLRTPSATTGGDGTRLFRGPDAKYPFPIYGISFILHSPAELLITAPDGSKTGFSPVSDTAYNEIPFANYLAEGYDNAETGEVEPHKVKFVNISGGPADGEYLVQVIGAGMGSYNLDVERIGTDGKPIDVVKQVDIPTQWGETHTYAIQYSASSSLSPKFEGGYDGGGQKPSDVNKFLRYSNPSSSRTALGAGTTHFRLGITYGRSTISGTFKATLNGADVSSLFSPLPGVSQVVQLPFVRGTNTLKLEIDGRTVSGRVATDTDRLVFDVP